jgi:glutaconate CoA-transferase subunit A
MAGGMNIPFIPTRSLLGSDIIKHNNQIKVIQDPYTSETVALVPAANPDVAFIHVQKADIEGNGQIWGITVNDISLCRAAKHVVLTCEEIVPTSEIRKIPNITAIPGYCVDAVVHVPYNSHPMCLYGYYAIDMPARKDFMDASKTQEGLEKWIQEWIFDTGSHEKYLEKVGYERLAMLTQIEQDNCPLPKIM